MAAVQKRRRRSEHAGARWLVAASIGSRPMAATVATDPRCPPIACCASVGEDGRGAGPGCFESGLWTAAYCCAQGLAADCYRWGEDAPGHDLAMYPVLSAVQCRHLCQSREDCEYWTYLVDVPELGDYRAQCHLKSALALQARLPDVHAYVVSGERHCRYFGEGLRPEAARARHGFDEVPWRTASSLDIASAAVAKGLAVVATAGSSEWHVEAAAIFASLGFVAVLDALTDSQVKRLRERSQRLAEKVLSMDPARLGNRGPRRYSFGALSPTNHLMHLPEWTQLLDSGPVSAVLQEIYPNGYLAAGGGGDFVLGGASTYQSLHLDIGGGLRLGGRSLHDGQLRFCIISRPPMCVG
mmetsp:Transcript_75273/g.244774  ORF Transcript_75273/g.244774 Transcript_75273/m.244774 type:complete len:355 (-) Transcript_75273:543-1607(-)